MKSIVRFDQSLMRTPWTRACPQGVAVDTQEPLLILDLDETLIHSAVGALTLSHDFRVSPFHVDKRPFLGQSLTTDAHQFRLAVWSSDSARYVAAILAEIIPVNITLEFQWSQIRCVNRYDSEREGVYWVKDLKKIKRLGYDLNRTLIVEDTPQKVERHDGNAIYIQPFTENVVDRELPDLADYLISLADCPNFRTIEKRTWRNKVVPTQ